MCDSEVISKLYVSVLHEDILKYHLSNTDIRTGIQNMKEVYLPNPLSLTNVILPVANYDDPAHRCAYLHKYAPFHTALVADMLQRAILQNPNVFQDAIFNYGRFNICSLGGGPGSDVIGALSTLNTHFGFFQVSATIIDYMTNWSQTFGSVIQELRYGSTYGSLGECVSDQYFSWSYVGANLLGKMSNEVHKAVATANLVTMIKFVSAAACKDTPEMIKKIFRTMKAGALVLYIDNAGGGFHNVVKKEAQECNLITIFGPLKHEHFSTNDFNVKRFGYTPCLETKVSVHIWRKPSLNASESSDRTTPLDEINRQQDILIINQPRSVPGRGRQLGTDVDSWQNRVNNHFQGVRPQPVYEWPGQNMVNNHFQGVWPQPVNDWQYVAHNPVAVYVNNRNNSNRGNNGNNGRRSRSKSRGRSPRRPTANQRQVRNNYNPMPTSDMPDDTDEGNQCCCVIS